MWNTKRWLARLKNAGHGWSSALQGATTMQTVLVVDDEESVLRFVRRVLEEAGLKTIVARDGAEAVLTAALVGNIDVLVTDLMMPHMNGDELARRLRAEQPDLPVLYLTGFSDRLFADRMQLWENEAFLDKPCSVRGLLEAVSLVSHRPVAGSFGVRAPAVAARADAAVVA